MIECSAVGPLEMTVDGAEPPADLMWRKNSALAVYLARTPGGKRTRDHLIGLLWADSFDEKARHSLRESLRVIRRCAGKDAVVAHANALEGVVHEHEALCERRADRVAEFQRSGACAAFSAVDGDEVGSDARVSGTSVLLEFYTITRALELQGE